LIMGNYWLILAAAKERNLALLAPVMLGCGLGLVVFSRLLDYVLKRFHDQTVGMLTGFVIGSLLIIWPWKDTLTEERELPNGEIKEAVTGYEWLLPQPDAAFFTSLALIAAGAGLVWIIEYLGAGRKDAATEEA
jgi:putative membrane protein